MKKGIRLSLKQLLMVYFSTTVYYVEKDKYLGDFVVRVPKYVAREEVIEFTNAMGEEKNIKYSDLFFFESNAKKEARKSVLPVPEGNLKLVKEIESAGIKLSKYQRQQIIEDGEASEIYQSLLAKEE